MATTDDVRRVAEQAGEAGDRGEASLQIGEVTFDLDETGYCARFVRECHEAALGQPEHTWKYGAPNALEMERKLKANGCEVSELERVPGDIIAINRDTGQYGHIGIYLGNGEFAENTSSTSRGPGTTVSDVAAIESRITGYYRDLPLPVNALVVKVIHHATGDVVCELAMVPGGDHIADQGKLYVTDNE